MKFLFGEFINRLDWFLSIDWFTRGIEYKDVLIVRRLIDHLDHLQSVYHSNIYFF